MVSVLAPMQRAHASGSFDVDGDYLPLGVNLGGAVDGNSKQGFILGSELSLVTLDRDYLWFGGVADVSWDFGADALRHRATLEGGLHVVGLELGYLGESKGERYRPGISSRLIGTTGVLSIYLGYGHLFGDGGPNDLMEFGLLLKFPVEVDD